MQQFSPGMIVYPQTILASLLAGQGISPREFLPKLKSVGLSSATSSHSRETMDTVAEQWGTRVSENYGCTQATNTVGLTCEHGLSGADASPLVHFLEERFIIECLDRETGEPGEGGPGMRNCVDDTRSRCLRRRSDIECTTEPCFCRISSVRAVALITASNPAPSVAGMDMMKIKGINCWPSSFDGAILSESDIVEYRGRVIINAEGLDEVRIDVSFSEKANPSPEWRRAFLHRLTGKIKERTFISVVLAESDTALEVLDTKPRRWIDDRKSRPLASNAA